MIELWPLFFDIKGKPTVSLLTKDKRKDYKRDFHSDLTRLFYSEQLKESNIASKDISKKG